MFVKRSLTARVSTKVGSPLRGGLASARLGSKLCTISSQQPKYKYQTALFSAQGLLESLLQQDDDGT
jgi:hypothetical protein